MRASTTLPPSGDGAGLDQSVAMHAVVDGLVLQVADRLDLVRPGRRHEVVEQRRAAGEALHAEELLGVERAVRRAMLGVALVRNVAAADVEHFADCLLRQSIGRQRCVDQQPCATGLQLPMTRILPPQPSREIQWSPFALRGHCSSL